MPRFRVNPDRSSERKPEPDKSVHIQNDANRSNATFGTCDLCKGENVALDFHHWNYENDIGCMICRQCHETIHQPFGAKPSETPGNEWIDKALVQLVGLYSEHHSWLSANRIQKEFSVPYKHLPTLKSYVAQAKRSTEPGTGRTEESSNE